MNKRFIALSAACMTAASIVSCSDSSSKSGRISDVASAINETISSDYKGIIASDAKYSLNDSKTIGYRSQILKKIDFDDEWILIANKNKVQLFYAKDWDDTAKGYKKAENDDDLTLAEIYKKYISNFKANDKDDDDNDDDGGMIGDVKMSKRSSANSKARMIGMVVESALTDADTKGYRVDDIGYIVFESGKITDINYYGKDSKKVCESIEKTVSLTLVTIKEIPYAVVFCDNGVVKEVYWSEKETAKISGSYPADEDCYDMTFEEVFDKKCDQYYVEPKPEEPTKPSKPPVQGNSHDLGSVRLGTGGDKFVVAGWYAPDVEELINNWCNANGYDENNVSFLDLNCSGGEASERYDARFASDEDIDLYFVEADWGCRYMDDDSRSAPLEDLGFSENNFKDCYNYTVEVGRATGGANSGKVVGAAYQACPGAFAYRSDLAKQYLGVNTPEEMQKKIGDWDKFTAAAVQVSEKSSGKIALVDSVDGMFHAYSQSRTTPWVVGNRINFDGSCEDFANKAKQLWDKGGVAHTQQWYDGWEQGGMDGSIMGYFVSTWGVSDDSFFSRASLKSYGKWNLVQGPSPYFWGGTWILAHPATDNGEEAQSFIYTSCVDSDSMLSYAAQTGEFVNSKTATHTLCEIKCGSDFVTDNFNGQNYLEVFDANAQAVDNKGLITPYDADIKITFTDVLFKNYLNGSSSYADVLSEVSKKMEKNF